MRTARVHHAARRRGGGVAARGARAAGGEAADHRVPGREHAYGLEPMGRRLSCSGCANSAGSKVAPSRSNIAGRRDAASAPPRSRPSSSGSRSTSLSRRERAVARGKAGDIGHPDRVCDGERPGRQRPGRKPGAAGRQRHRPVASRRPILPASGSNSCARSSPRSAGWRSWPMSSYPDGRARDARGPGGGPHARHRGRATRNPASRRTSRPPSRRSRRSARRALCRGRPARRCANRPRINTLRSARGCRRCSAPGLRRSRLA